MLSILLITLVMGVLVNIALAALFSQIFPVAFFVVGRCPAFRRTRFATMARWLSRRWLAGNIMLCHDLTPPDLETRSMLGSILALLAASATLFAGDWVNNSGLFRRFYLALTHEPAFRSRFSPLPVQEGVTELRFAGAVLWTQATGDGFGERSSVDERGRIKRFLAAQFTEHRRPGVLCVFLGGPGRGGMAQL
ncbi:hypothetical protein ACFPL7_03725 [Dongia soli]|uniref:Uncharacterized protein n=1 Tax=Dongia soli TaxID=600628 RepID=A0ABU5EEZ6_9PROT|nr:hypothetical protein [Dongia soli]MDY0884599.1 hypothetical protein [Dongia soli]